MKAKEVSAQEAEKELAKIKESSKQFLKKAIDQKKGFQRPLAVKWCGARRMLCRYARGPCDIATLVPMLVPWCQCWY
eukprot:1335717-Rhodomonas_salina.2